LKFTEKHPLPGDKRLKGKRDDNEFVDQKPTDWEKRRIEEWEIEQAMKHQFKGRFGRR